MTGWRIGFGLAPEAVTGAMRKLQSHSTSNPTSIAQKAAVEALTGPQDSVAGDAGGIPQAPRLRGAAAAAIPGVKLHHAGTGAFYAYPNIGGVREAGIGLRAAVFAERLLAEAHVAVVPGEAFGTDEHVRISYATSMKELERGLDRIEAFHQPV